MRWRTEETGNGPWNIVILEATLFRVTGRALNETAFLKRVQAAINSYWATPRGIVGLPGWTPAEAARWALQFLFLDLGRKEQILAYPLQATGYAPSGPGFEFDNDDFDQGRGRIPAQENQFGVVATQSLVKEVKLQ
jgi:hypothetical protein